MRSTLAIGALVFTFAVACGGGGAQPTGPAVQRTAEAPATAAGQQSAPPAQPGGGAGGGGVATVVLTGGPDAGTYAGNEPPNCSQGIVGPEGWGVQYSTVNVGDDGLGSVQIVSAAPGMEDHEDAFMSGVTLLTTVTVGPSLGEGSRDYEIRVSDDDEASGTGTANVTDNGDTAVIHVTGTTEDGVSMDITINCPSVVRT